MFHDENSDGLLDRRLAGPAGMSDVQAAYKKVLKRGLAEGRIRRTGGRYVVVGDATVQGV